jgi:hypothetical protein
MEKMMVLLLGAHRDASIQHLVGTFEEVDQGYFILDAQRLLTDYLFSYCPNINDGWLSDGRHTVALSDFSSAFWSQVKAPELTQEKAILPIDIKDERLSKHIYQQELNCFLQMLLDFSKIRWCNSWRAFQMHKTKPLQLAIVKALGARIPATQVSNIFPIESNRSGPKHSCIVKPVHAGYMTQAIDTQNDPSATPMDSHTLAGAIKGFPFSLQDRIAGENIRTYVIGEKIFSGLIETERLDYRLQTAEEQTVHPIQLSKQEERLAQQIRISLEMQWTAIDWIRDEEGKLVFLEANPAPMFVGFEKLTSYPLTKALLSLLLEAN